MYSPIGLRSYPTDTFATPNAKLKVQPGQACFADDVFDQCRVLLKVWRIRHIVLDVLQRFFLCIDLQIDQQVRAIVLQHKSPKQEFAKGTFE